MSYQADYYTLQLYLLKQVAVTFTDGRLQRGVLTNVMPTDRAIMLDGETYPISEVADVEMVGEISYHTYADDSQKVCDIGGLFFGLDDFAEGTDVTKLLCNEFCCEGACHLAFLETKLAVKDVRILSASHRVYLPALGKMPYIYLLRDGSVVVGTAAQSEPLSVQTAVGPSVPVNTDEVLDIIRLPRTNDFVEVTLKNGQVVSGVVSAANEAIVVLIGEAVQTVEIGHIRSLRYRGTITVGVAKLPGGAVKQVKLSLGVKDESFLCKIPYFHSAEDELAAVDGATATFVPGVTARGLIAKDVAVESDPDTVVPDMEFETGIIVIAPTPSRTTGYIGREFITKTYSLVEQADMPRGTVSFTADQVPFRMTPHEIYVVRYQCNHNEVSPKARNMELQESYPMEDYARIWIDEQGTVQKLPVSVLFLDKFLNKTIDVETNDTKRYTGLLKAETETEITLVDGNEERAIRTGDILRVFYFGTVTAYQPNSGTGFINGQYWFHVNNFTDMNQVVYLKVGASVRFSFEGSAKGNMCAATRLEILDSTESRGYVLKFVNQYAGKGYGFLIPPELLEQHLRDNDRTGTIYFQETDVKNTKEFKIDTNKYYYAVSYTMGDNNTAYNVRFLEEYLFAMEVTAEEIPEPQKEDTKTHTETMSIADLAEPTVALADAEYEYGLLNIFSTHYALVNPQYLNRDYIPDGTYDAEQTVCFNPEEVTLSPDQRLKAQKYSYLVRYVKKGTVVNPTTGIEQPTIDYTYPVEVVHAFPKKRCVSIHLDGDKVTVTYAEDPAENRVAAGAAVPAQPQQSTLDRPPVQGGAAEPMGMDEFLADAQGETFPVEPVTPCQELDETTLAVYDEIIENWSIEARKENSAYFYNVKEVDVIASGKKSFVIGRKGCGKTAIAQHLCDIREYNVFSDKLSFKNFPFNILYSLENNNEYTTPNQYISIWKYLIYSYICKKMLDNNHVDSGIREQLATLYGERNGSTPLNRLIEKWTSKSFGFQLLGFGLNYEREKQHSESTWIENIEVLQRLVIDYWDDSYYYIVFDELDEDYKDFDSEKEYLQYTCMLTSLFKAVQDIRETFDGTGKRIFPVVFLRSDIYARLTDSDKNKWYESIIDLEWDTMEIKNMLAHRLCVCFDIEDTDFDTIWYRLFRHEGVKMGNQQARKMDIYSYIERSTEMRPRDFIQYVREAVTLAKERKEKPIRAQTVKDADDDFSEYLKRETIDELFATMPEVNEILGLLSTIRKQSFQFHTFEEEYNKLVERGAVPRRDVKTILLSLFDAGVIGNLPTMRGQAIFRFSKKSPRFNFNEPMIIHRGLYKALQIF